ncbi:hypothetical protein ABZ845_12750 [Streptomyces sp. NPDC047022]|uniref:hypothetical protein n=1 Tax=Streptomyces sp. NPDC047022 TaxID=3155737 RepID=UPI0033C2CA13
MSSCLVNRPDTGQHGGALDVRIRWSSDEVPSGAQVWYEGSDDDFRGRAAPLGGGWPGIVRADGDAQVIVALDCRNQKNKALVVQGDLVSPPQDTRREGTVADGLGRVTAETALKAAGRYGCEASGGGKLTQVRVPDRRTTGSTEPVEKAEGSCSAVRGLSRQATAAGVPDIMEYPADSRAPQVNCYLLTPGKKPGYGLYAYYGAVAKDFRVSSYGGGSRFTGKDTAWATARCPQYAEPARFALYRLHEPGTDRDAYSVRAYSADFAEAALKSFADDEAKRRGCTDVRMVSGPAV